MQSTCTTQTRKVGHARKTSIPTAWEVHGNKTFGGWPLRRDGFVVGQEMAEDPGGLAHLAYNGLVHQPDFPLPPPQRGVVGVERLLQALFSRNGGDYRLGIARRKSG